jgi:hypothetical protein
MERLREMARACGAVVAQEAYGDDGPGLDVDLAGMEEIAWEVAQGITQGTCEELTRRQARKLPTTQPCPTCGAECAVAYDESSRDDARPMQVRSGSFQLKEPRAWCDRCERSFFPSASGAAH